AEQHFRQRNRLVTLEAEIAPLEAATEVAQRAGMAARAARIAAADEARAAALSQREAELTLVQARAADAELTRQAMSVDPKLAAVVEALDKPTADAADADGHLSEVERGIALLPDPSLARAGLDTARAQAASARTRDNAAQVELDRLRREAATRGQRLAAI